MTHDTIREPLLFAAMEIERLTELVYTQATLTEPTPMERVALAGDIGRLAGIGIGIRWISKYEMNDRSDADA